MENALKQDKEFELALLKQKQVEQETLDYLQSNIGEALTRGIIALAQQQPKDAVSYLVEYLRRYVSWKRKLPVVLKQKENLKKKRELFSKRMKAQEKEKHQRLTYYDEFGLCKEDYTTLDNLRNRGWMNKKDYTELLNYIKKSFNASGVYIAKLDRKLNESDDNGYEGYSNTAVISYIYTDSSSNFLLDRFLLPNEGVTWKLFTEEDKGNDERGEENNTIQNDDDFDDFDGDNNEEHTGSETSDDDENESDLLRKKEKKRKQRDDMVRSIFEAAIKGATEGSSYFVYDSMIDKKYSHDENSKKRTVNDNDTKNIATDDNNNSPQNGGTKDNVIIVDTEKVRDDIKYDNTTEEIFEDNKRKVNSHTSKSYITLNTERAAIQQEENFFYKKRKDRKKEDVEKKILYFQEVMTEPSIKFWNMMKPGSYAVIPIRFSSCLNDKSLSLACEYYSERKKFEESKKGNDNRENENKGKIEESDFFSKRKSNGSSKRFEISGDTDSEDDSDDDLEKNYEYQYQFSDENEYLSEKDELNGYSNNEEKQNVVGEKDGFIVDATIDLDKKILTEENDTPVKEKKEEKIETIEIQSNKRSYTLSDENDIDQNSSDFRKENENNSSNNNDNHNYEKGADANSENEQNIISNEANKKMQAYLHNEEKKIQKLIQFPKLPMENVEMIMCIDTLGKNKVLSEKEIKRLKSFIGSIEDFLQDQHTYSLKRQAKMTIDKEKKNNEVKKLEFFLAEFFNLFEGNKKKREEEIIKEIEDKISFQKSIYEARVEEKRKKKELEQKEKERRIIAKKRNIMKLRNEHMQKEQKEKEEMSRKLEEKRKIIKKKVNRKKDSNNDNKNGNKNTSEGDISDEMEENEAESNDSDHSDGDSVSIGDNGQAYNQKRATNTQNNIDNEIISTAYSAKKNEGDGHNLKHTDQSIVEGIDLDSLNFETDDGGDESKYMESSDNDESDDQTEYTILPLSQKVFIDFIHSKNKYIYFTSSVLSKSVKHLCEIRKMRIPPSTSHIPVCTALLLLLGVRSAELRVYKYDYSSDWDWKKISAHFTSSFIFDMLKFDPTDPRTYDEDISSLRSIESLLDGDEIDNDNLRHDHPSLFILNTWLLYAIEYKKNYIKKRLAELRQEAYFEKTQMIKIEEIDNDFSHFMEENDAHSDD